MIALVEKHQNRSIGKILLVFGFGLLVLVFILLSALSYESAPPTLTMEPTILSSSPQSSEDIIQRSAALATSMEENKVTPMAEQIVTIDPTASNILVTDSSFQARYTEFWQTLQDKASKYSDYNIDTLVTAEEMAMFEANFFSRIGYTRAENGFIYSNSRNVVSPETLMCQINGYIPDKEFIKPNCPEE